MHKYTEMRVLCLIVWVKLIMACEPSSSTQVITKNGSISSLDFRNGQNITKLCIQKSSIVRLFLTPLCRMAKGLTTIEIDEYTTIPKQGFVSDECDHVKILKLLSVSFYLEHDTFVAFTGLEKLTFSYGKSPPLMTKTILHGLDDLTSLTITHTDFQRITSSAFEHLRNLTYLNMRFNKLEVIDAHAFKNLQKLEVLDLSFNFLKDLYYDKFQGLENLKSFYFFGSGNYPSEIREFLLYLPMKNLQDICIDNYTWSIGEKLKWYGELMECFKNLTTICYISVKTYFPTTHSVV